MARKHGRLSAFPAPCSLASGSLPPSSLASAPGEVPSAGRGGSQQASSPNANLHLWRIPASKLVWGWQRSATDQSTARGMNTSPAAGLATSASVAHAHSPVSCCTRSSIATSMHPSSTSAVAQPSWPWGVPMPNSAGRRRGTSGQTQHHVPRANPASRAEGDGRQAANLRVCTTALWSAAHHGKHQRHSPAPEAFIPRTRTASIQV